MNESDEVELSVMTVAHLAESLSPQTTPCTSRHPRNRESRQGEAGCEYLARATHRASIPSAAASAPKPLPLPHPSNSGRRVITRPDSDYSFEFDSAWGPTLFYFFTKQRVVFQKQEEFRVKCTKYLFCVSKQRMYRGLFHNETTKLVTFTSQKLQN